MWASIRRFSGGGLRRLGAYQEIHCEVLPDGDLARSRLVSEQVTLGFEFLRAGHVIAGLSGGRPSHENRNEHCAYPGHVSPVRLAAHKDPRAMLSASRRPRSRLPSIDMAELYIPLCVPPEKRDQPALWFAFRRSDILVINGEKLPELPYCMDLSEHGLAAQRAQYLGLYRGRHCYAAAIGESQALPEGWSALACAISSGSSKPLLPRSADALISCSNGSAIISSAAGVVPRRARVRTSVPVPAPSASL
jgi:NADH pyrophosphatase-like rudimentary NUDIX domain